MVDRQKYQIRIFLIVLVCLAAIIVRLPTLDFFQQHSLHPDDNYIVNPAVQIAADFRHNPKQFGLPDSSLFYLLGFSYKIVSQLAKINGGEAINVIADYQAESSWLYILARIWNLFFIVGIVIMTYLLTWRISRSDLGAVIASASIVFSSLLIENVAYIRPDILLTLLGLVVLWYCFNIERRGKMRDYLLAGVSCGLAVATKYPGIILIVPILFAHFFKQNKIKSGVFDKKIACGLLLIPLVFLVVTPHFLFSLAEVKNDFWYEAVREHGAAAGSFFSNLYFYLKTSFNYGLGTFISVWAGLTILLTLFKSKKIISTTQNIIILSYFLLFWLGLSGHKLHWDRWLIPILPLVALYAGLGISYLKNILRFQHYPLMKKNIALIVLMAVIMVPVVMRGIKMSYVFTKPDTAIEAATWINNNLEEGAVIYVDSHVPLLDVNKFKVVEEFFLFENHYQDYIAQGARYLVIDHDFTRQAINYEKRKPEFKENYEKLLKEKPAQKLFPGTTGQSLEDQIYLNDWQVLKNFFNFQAQKGSLIGVYKLS